MDVVQSAWADVLKGFHAEGWQFNDRDHLRAYLARVTYNHFAKNCRQNSHAMQLEQPFLGGEPPGLPPSEQPRPSELAQADELWELLMNPCPRRIASWSDSRDRATRSPRSPPEPGSTRAASADPLRPGPAARRRAGRVRPRIRPGGLNSTEGRPCRAGPAGR